MWREIGQTVRDAITDWGKTARLGVCVTMGTGATMAIIWLTSLR
ncbi:hypothetical protein [Nocardia brasiliensis]